MTTQMSPPALPLPSQPSAHPRKLCTRLALLLSCACLMLATPAHAEKKRTAHTAKAAAKSKSAAVKIQRQRNSSEESAAERDRRLLRECQGRPNAGACAGYTHK